MAGSDSRLDPATEAAIEQALEAANLRAGDGTAAVVHLDHSDMVVDDGGAGDGD